MKHYIGFDVSNKTIFACVLDETGTIIDEQEFFNNQKDILKYLSTWKDTTVRIGFEVGQMAPWLYHMLVNAGYPAICLEIKHTSAAIKSQPIKTDRNDANGIAQMLRLGWFKATYVKSPEMQKLRMLLCHRQQLNQQIQTLMNTIRGSLKSFGIKLGCVSRKNFATVTYEKIGDDGLMLQAVEPLITALEHMEASFAALDKTVRLHASKDPICQKLMTVPGMGSITSLAFRATIEDPQRFHRVRDIGAFLGLIPRKYASGEIDRNGHITKYGDQSLRSYMYEAGVVVLTRLKKWCSLKAWGVQIAKRSNFKKAAVALARKLSIICLRIWKDNTEFNWGSEKLAA